MNELLDLNLLLLLKSQSFVVLVTMGHRGVTVSSGIDEFLLLFHDSIGCLTEPFNQSVQLTLKCLFLFFLDRLKKKLKVWQIWAYSRFRCAWFKSGKVSKRVIAFIHCLVACGQLCNTIINFNQGDGLLTSRCAPCCCLQDHRLFPSIKSVR